MSTAERIARAVALAAAIGCEAGPAVPPGDAGAGPLPGAPAAAVAVRAVLDALPPPPGDGLTREVALVDPDGAVRAALARGLERAAGRVGTLRMAFFGSSHVAGDLVTGFLRQRLQRHFGDAGHGYVTALPPYGGYWQWGARVEEGEGWAVAEPTLKDLSSGAYGLTGMAFDAVEPAWAAAATDDAPASHIEVLYLRQPGGGLLSLHLDGTPLSIDTAFEREAAGIAYVAAPDGPHRMELSATGAGPTRVFGLVFEREAPGVLVDQLGVNGMTPAIALRSDPGVFAELLRARRPDVVAVWLGANEASEPGPLEDQAAHLRALLARLREAVPGAACLVLGPLDRRQHRPDGTPFVPPALAGLLETHRAVADGTGCAYFDSFAWQGGPGAVERFEGAEPPLVRPDRVHLTHDGYVRYGASLLRALLSPLLSDAPGEAG